MSERKNSLLLSTIIAAALVMMTSCSRLPIYSHFETVGADGWDRTDTLRFIVPIPHDGIYVMHLDLRADSRYPYTQLMLTVLTPHPLPFTIDITDEEGNFQGRGSGIFQYTVALPSNQLTKGDTLTISVAHGMSRQVLPGIQDVGITVEEKE